MSTMPTKPFTTRLDVGVQAELEQIARYEDRSSSYLVSQAVVQLVQERKATRELIATGLALIEGKAPSVSPEAVHEWLLSDEETTFPEFQATKS